MKKYKNIIYIVIAIIVVGLLIYFVFIPQIKSITLLWVKNSIKQDQVSSLDQEKSQINNLKNQAKDAEDLMNVLATILPNNKDTGRFMINLEALAQDTNTDFADIKFSEPKQTASSAAASSSKETTSQSSVKAASTSAAKFKTLTFEITDKGSYADVMNFLQGLEKINRAISIEKADLSLVQTTVQASIKGTMYYKND